MPISIETVAGHSFVGSWLGPESVVVDLGVNIGRFSYEIQRRYNCRIAGVEANPALAQAIVQADRLSCTNLAITANAGPIEFFIDPQNTEASSTDRQSGGTDRQRIVVDGKTFADFVTAEHFRRIDLLKIDIEGAELDLLETIPYPILQDIWQICVEFHAFLRPQDLPRIEAVIGGMRARNFFVLDFSRNFGNVLMINEQHNRLTIADRATLHTTRLVEGVKRMAHRRLQGNH